LYKATGLKIYGVQGIEKGQEIDTYMSVEMVNLCTVAGMQQRECNCNKPVRISGDYHRWLDVEGGWSGSSWTGFAPHGREGEFMDSYIISSLDLNTNNPGSNSFTSGNLTILFDDVLHDEFSYHTNLINIPAAAEAAAHLATLIVSNFNLINTITIEDGGSLTGPNGSTNWNTTTVTNPSSSGFTDFANAISNIIGSSHTMGSKKVDYKKITPFDGFTMLKANTPKVIIYHSLLQTKLRAYGPKFWDIRIEARTFMNTTHVIEHFPYAYDQDGELIGQDWDCCNEAYGWWHHSKSNIPSWSNHKISLVDLQNQIMKDLNYVGFRRWSWASNNPDDPQNAPPTADVNFANLAAGLMPITAINWPVGEVGSSDYCGCENLNDPQQPQFLLNPTLYSKDDCLNPGNQQVLITDFSFPLQQVNAGKINTYWMYNHAQLPAQNNLPLGAPNTPQISVSQSGLYALVYEDAQSPICRTIEYFYLPDCPTKWQGDLESISLTVTPNPASSEMIITLPDLTEGELSVTNSNGQIMFMEGVTDRYATINVSNWPNGFYVLSLRNENTTTHAKFVVSH
jgi:hypothetical protein